MLTLVTMDKGHTVDELFTPENIEQWKAIDEGAPRQRRRSSTSSRPLTALQFNDDLVTRPERRPDPERRRQDPRSTASRASKPTGGARPRAARTRSTTLAAHQRDPGRASGRSTTRTTSTSCSTTTRASIRKPLLRVLPRRPPRADRHAAAGQRVDRGRRQGRRPRARRRPTKLALRRTRRSPPPARPCCSRTSTTTSPAACSRSARSRSRSWRHPAGAVQRAVAAAAARRSCSSASIWAFGIAGYLGIPLTIVTIAGLPVMLGIGIDYAIQMHARVEEEVVIDRAEHPIQETAAQPRARAARRHVRRDLRLRGAALRQGADDPPVRSAARGRRRRDLPLQHRRHARGPRHPRVQVADEAAATSARARSAGSSCGSAALPAEASRSALAVASLVDLRRRHRSSRASSCCRPTRSSGSTRTRR